MKNLLIVTIFLFALHLPLGMLKCVVGEEGFCSAPPAYTDSSSQPMYWKVTNPTLSPVHLQGKDMGNWSNLCRDILELIVDEFSAIEDIVRFGAVCRQWRSVSVVKRQLSMVYPWLMLAEKEDHDRRGFYCLSTQKVYHMNLPEACGRRCWSSKGWLMTFGLDLEIHLLNLFSRVQIRLPPQPTLPDQYPPESAYTPKELLQVFIRKVALSSTPLSLSVKTTPRKGDDDDDEKLVVMAISSQFNKLAFLRLGDQVWTAIECPSGFCDIICFNSQFYAVNTIGELFICDISSPQPTTIEFAGPLENRASTWYEYSLVESLGELFLVARDYKYCLPEFDEHGDEEHGDEYGAHRYETIWFDVYKFNFDYRKWSQVKSLDNRALFLGNNNSFAIFPSDKHPGCEPNCIYYTDSCRENLMDGAGHDMGVFGMETGNFESHYEGPDFFSHYCTPLWIYPSM